MGEAIRELMTVKFWMLALVGIFLSILANFATDWIKAAIKSRIAGEQLEKFLSIFSRRSALLIASCALLSSLSLVWMKLDYYWTPKIIACCVGVFYALEFSEAIYEQFPSDFPCLNSIVRNTALLVFTVTWFVIFGLPRVAYWLIELDQISFLQALGVLITGYIAFWVVTVLRSSRRVA